jgi:hypothetical protein
MFRLIDRLVKQFDHQYRWATLVKASGQNAQRASPSAPWRTCGGRRPPETRDALGFDRRRPAGDFDLTLYVLMLCAFDQRF